MKHIRKIIFMACLVLLIIPRAGFSEMDLNFTDETERWKLYHETVGGDNGWELKKDKSNGVKVYTRKVAVSPIKSFRGIVEVEADFETLVAFIADPDSYPSYVYLCNKAEILKQETPNDYYLRSENEPPWPVKKRDTISHTVWHQDPETYAAVMDAIAVPALIPERKGFIRTPLLFINVIVTPKGNGMNEVVFEGVAEVGGMVPDVIANFCVTWTPEATLGAIKDKRPFEKFAGKKFEWLKAPPAQQKQ